MLMAARIARARLARPSPYSRGNETVEERVRLRGPHQMWPNGRCTMGSSTRREFLQIAGVGGVVFASGLLEACSKLGTRPDPSPAMADDFYFVQLSDTHWGYKGPANPEATVELPRAIDLVNALPQAPDFVVFTGDLTHTTDDDQERRRRLAEFRERLKPMRAPMVRLMAGEHDASADKGK